MHDPRNKQKNNVTIHPFDNPSPKTPPIPNKTKHKIQNPPPNTRTHPPQPKKQLHKQALGQNSLGPFAWFPFEYTSF